MSALLGSIVGRAAQYSAFRPGDQSLSGGNATRFNVHATLTGLVRRENVVRDAATVDEFSITRSTGALNR